MSTAAAPHSTVELSFEDRLVLFNLVNAEIGHLNENEERRSFFTERKLHEVLANLHGLASKLWDEAWSPRKEEE